MLKRASLVTFGTLILGVTMAVLVALPVGLALAQATPGALGDFIMPTSTPGGAPPATSAPGGLGDFIMPTSTPGSVPGGFAIPTSTPAGGLPGGLVIPTATPGGAAESMERLPRLTDAQLQDLNIPDEEVNAPFGAADVSTFDVAELISQLEAANMGNLANDLRAMSQQYGWTHSVGVGYAACDQSLPVAYLYSEVGQLASTPLARAFIEDARLRDFYNRLGMTVTPATSVHGYSITDTPSEGDCFANETSYLLMFEYWGLLISVSVDVNSATDPALANNLLDQMAQMVVARVDQLAGGSLPPTPAPGAQAGQPVVTQAPLVLPPTTTPSGGGVGAVTLADIDAIMPLIGETGLPTNTYSLNTQLSQVMTQDQVNAFFDSTGLPSLAAAVEAVMRKSNMIGQVVRVWDTAGACPQVLATSVEVDVLLFQDTSGPAIFLTDQQYKAALAAFGTQFQTAQDGGWYSWFSFTGDCGDMTTYSRSAPNGRFVLSASVIAYAQADRDTIVQALDTLVDYMAQKLDQAGLE